MKNAMGQAKEVEIGEKSHKGARSRMLSQSLRKQFAEDSWGGSKGTFGHKKKSTRKGAKAVCGGRKGG